MSDVNADPTVERVAEAIWRADPLGPDCTSFAAVDDDCQDWYKHMARAAIEALGIETDWAIGITGEPFTIGNEPRIIECDDQEHAQRSADNAHTPEYPAHVYTRLVGQWTRVEGED